MVKLNSAQNMSIQQTGHTGSGFVFKTLGNIILRRKWMLIIPLFIIPPIVYTGSLYLEDIYGSEIIISLGGRFQISNALENALGFDPNLIGRIENRRDEIKGLHREVTSSLYLQQLGRLLRMDQEPQVQEQAAYLKALRPRMTDSEALNKVIVDILKEKVSIRWAGEDQIGLRAFDSDPQRARDIAKYLGEIFIQEQVRNKIGAMRYNEDISWELLDKYERELKNKLDDKTALAKEFTRLKIDSVIEDPVNRNDINFDLETARAEVAALESSLDRYREKIAKIPGALAVTVKSDRIAEINAEIDRTYSGYLEIVLAYPWKSYEIYRVRNRVVELLDRADALIDNEVNAGFPDLTETDRNNLKNFLLAKETLYAERLRLDYLERAERRLEERLTIIPEFQAKFDHLEREIAAAQELRDQFRQQQESNVITQAILRQSEYKVVQDADVPLRPIEPDRQLLLILSFVLALILGVAVITFNEIYSNTFRKAGEIEKTLGLPVLGIVPDIKSFRKIGSISQ